jgi:hypothetical protein
MKKLPAVIFMVIALALSAFAKIETDHAIYGSGIFSQALNNIPVRIQSVSYRFLSTHSGKVKDVVFYLITNGPHAGYNAGTGGTLQIDLETDDGSRDHNPSRMSLGSASLPQPDKSKGVFDVELSPQPVLKEGSIYHLVFSNTDFDATDNYVSLDDAWLSSPLKPMQPRFSDEDWATLQTSGPISDWQVYRYNTPIMEVDFTDGAALGMGYMEFWPEFAQEVSTGHQVREKFTVSGADRVATSVSVTGILKKSGREPLTVELQNANGETLERRTIGADRIPTGDNCAHRAGSPNCGAWNTVQFSHPETLATGKTYYLLLSTTGEGDYRAYPIRRGVNYGFQPATYFNDGYSQFMAPKGAPCGSYHDSACTASGDWDDWWAWGKGGWTQQDLQFYFSLK